MELALRHLISYFQRTTYHLVPEPMQLIAKINKPKITDISQEFQKSEEEANIQSQWKKNGKSYKATNIRLAVSNNSNG